jgi:hypothetical protein
VLRQERDLDDRREDVERGQAPEAVKAGEPLWTRSRDRGGRADGVGDAHALRGQEREGGAQGVLRIIGAVGGRWSTTS